METSTIWWLLAGGFVVLELTTGTFYFLMFALGMATAAICAHIGLNLTSQMLIGALTGAGAVAGWHFKRHTQKLSNKKSDANPDLHIDIGSVVHVDTWDASGTALVMHRGASWSARLAYEGLQTNERFKIGAHRITAIEGNTLVLKSITT